MRVCGIAKSVPVIVICTSIIELFKSFTVYRKYQTHISLKVLNFFGCVYIQNVMFSDSSGEIVVELKNRTGEGGREQGTSSQPTERKNDAKCQHDLLRRNRK